MVVTRAVPPPPLGRLPCGANCFSAARNLFLTTLLFWDITIYMGLLKVRRGPGAGCGPERGGAIAVGSLQLTATMEDYLESILLLSRERRVVRMRDIASLLGVTPSTATGAVQALKKHGLLAHEKYEDVILTARGQAIAEDVYQRHEDIRDFLQDVLLLDSDMAEQEACRMEHSIAPLTLERLRRFAGVLRMCDQGEPGCLRAFRTYIDTGEAVPPSCAQAGGPRSHPEGVGQACP